MGSMLAYIAYMDPMGYNITNIYDIYIYMILVSENEEITVNLWGTEWGPC